MNGLTPLVDINESLEYVPVVAFMSGSGSNIRELIKHQNSIGEESPFKVELIFADNLESNARKIAEANNLPVVELDIGNFYEEHNTKRTMRTQEGQELRAEYERTALEEMAKVADIDSVKIAAYGGYMSIASPVFIEKFVGINVHPANLSLTKTDGTRKYTGDNAVYDIIIDTLRYLENPKVFKVELRSSTHLVEPVVDGGRLLMISSPIHVELKAEYSNGVSNVTVEEIKRSKTVGQAVADYNQDRLKVAGDWIIFPKSVEHVAAGRFSQDADSFLYFDSKPAFNGLRLE